MASYKDLQNRYYSGEHPDKILTARFSPKDYSVERAIDRFDGSHEAINTLHYAVRCTKDKIAVAEALEKRKIDPEIIPYIYGSVLKVRGEFDYDTILSQYLESDGGSKERFAIHAFVRESEDPEETREAFIADGVNPAHILYKQLPDNVIADIEKHGVNALIKLHKANYPLLDVAIYDYFKSLKSNRIQAFRTLESAGIPKTTIDQTGIAKLLSGRFTFRDIRILYNFKSPYFEEFLEYMIENHFGYGENNVIDLLNKLVRYGIDKETLLSGTINYTK